MPNKDLLLQYANLKIQAKKIEQEMEMLQPQVLAEVLSIVGDGTEQVALQDLPGVSLTLATRKTWTYSEFTQASEVALKDRKAEEQKTGEATFTEEKQLRVNLPKE